MIQSAINGQLIEQYMCFEKENQKFDRKSAKKDIKEIANHIAGFANADGGTLVNCLIRNVKDEVYLRRGDSKIKLTDEQIQVLKVDRAEVSYENQIVLESSIEDIDEDIYTKNPSVQKIKII